MCSPRTVGLAIGPPSSARSPEPVRGYRRGLLLEVGLDCLGVDVAIGRAVQTRGVGLEWMRRKLLHVDRDRRRQDSGSGSEDSGAIASAEASCACSASGVQAKVPNKVDLSSQLFAVWRRFP